MSTNINPQAGNTNGENIFKNIQNSHMNLEKFEIVSRPSGGEILKVTFSKKTSNTPIVKAMSVKKVLRSIDFFDIDMDPYKAAIKIVMEFGVDFSVADINNIP